MNSFDPNQFLDMQVDGANDTVLRPVPVDDYTAICTECTVRPWQGTKDPTQSGLALDLKWEIDSPALKEELGRTPTVKQGIMLDMILDSSGQPIGLDMGKGRNVGLGRLREAMGLNQAGRPFSFSMIAGNAAKIKVTHRPDKNNPEVTYAEVKEVAAL